MLMPLAPASTGGHPEPDEADQSFMASEGGDTRLSVRVLGISQAS